MVHTLYGCLSFQECHGKVNNAAVYSLFVASLAKVVRRCMTTYNKLGIIIKYRYFYFRIGHFRGRNLQSWGTIRTTGLNIQQYKGSCHDAMVSTRLQLEWAAWVVYAYKLLPIFGIAVNRKWLHDQPLEHRSSRNVANIGAIIQIVISCRVVFPQ